MLNAAIYCVQTITNPLYYTFYGYHLPLQKENLDHVMTLAEAELVKYTFYEGEKKFTLLECSVLSSSKEHLIRLFEIGKRRDIVFNNSPDRDGTILHFYLENLEKISDIRGELLQTLIKNTNNILAQNKSESTPLKLALQKMVSITNLHVQERYLDAVIILSDKDRSDLKNIADLSGIRIFQKELLDQMAADWSSKLHPQKIYFHNKHTYLDVIIKCTNLMHKLFPNDDCFLRFKDFSKCVSSFFRQLFERMTEDELKAFLVGMFAQFELQSNNSSIEEKIVYCEAFKYADAGKAFIYYVRRFYDSLERNMKSGFFNLKQAEEIVLNLFENIEKCLTREQSGWLLSAIRHSHFEKRDVLIDKLTAWKVIHS